jgi:hypothetical protein
MFSAHSQVNIYKLPNVIRVIALYFILASYERAREIIGADLYHVRVVVQVLMRDKSWPLEYAPAQKVTVCRVSLIDDPRFAALFLVSLSIVEQVLLDGGDVLIHGDFGFYLAPAIAAAYAFALSGIKPPVFFLVSFDRFRILFFFCYRRL